MRSGGNVHPEWGYLAPAPSFMRTARIALVATAIGATASAGVVLSLMDRPAASPMADAGKSVVVVRSLVQPAEAAVPPLAPVVTAAAPIATPAPMQVSPQQTAAAPSPEGVQQMAAPASGETAPDAPASIAAVDEAAPATEATPAIATDEAAATTEAQKKSAKKHSDGKRRWADNGRGLPPILRSLFSARGGPNYR